MPDKEIALLHKQIEKLYEKSFDLGAWKNQTLLFLNRIFGASHAIVKMISNLKYDYSSWNLRDATGNEKLDDPVKMQAREILEAAVQELETLGLPEQGASSNTAWAILEEELTGKQLRELKEIAAEKDEDKLRQFAEKLNHFDKGQLVNLLSRILIS
ncbi:hypothetical protein [Gaoshiqia sp. Z1-71]|uniref:hypothetical protein n=1 Tax=Gaoshiqia hydrogeniformans TaxID=3290090 RepID=UPI003BF78E4C